MKTLKTLLFSLLTFVLVFSLFGCNSTNSSDSKNTASNGQESLGKKVELKIWSYANSDGRFKVFQGYIDEWNNKNPNLHVTFEQIPTDQYFGEKLSSALIGGNGPDVFFLSRGDFLKYSENGILAPLNDYFTDNLKKDFLPQVLDAATINGKILVYPMEMDPVVLYYDKALFEENKIPAPKTWKEMTDAAIKLTTQNRYGIYLAPAPNAYQNFVFSPFVWQGGSDFADDQIKKALFSGKGAVQALQLWKELADKNATPKTALTEPLANGLVAMEVAGPWKISSYKRNFADFYEKKMGIVPLPVPDGGKNTTVYGGWGLSLNSKSKNQKEAAKFLMWLFSEPERAAKWTVEARSAMSPQESIRNTELIKKFWGDPKLKIFMDELKTARPEAANPPEINKIIQDAIQGAFNNKGTAEELVNTANKQIEEYIKTRK